jgi:hypothetical protein
MAASTRAAFAAFNLATSCALLLLLLGTPVLSQPCSSVLVCLQQTAPAAVASFTLPAGILSGPNNCGITVSGNTSQGGLQVLTIAGSLCGTTGTCPVTTIDCSASGSRCLVVTNVNVTLRNIVFAGGVASSAVMPADVSLMLAAVRQQLLASSVSGINPKLMSTGGLDGAASTEASSHAQTRGWRQQAARDLGGATLPKNGLLRSRTRQVDDRFFGGETFAKPSLQEQQQHPQRSGSRRLLQSTSNAGGCVYISSPGGSVVFEQVTIPIVCCDVTLLFVLMSVQVTFNRCHATFGGGVFAAAATIAATGLQASFCTARQGGGAYLSASQSSTLSSCSFNSNAAASNLPSTSMSTALNFYRFRIFPFSVTSAMGGGLWVSSLSRASNMSFSGNLAVASGQFNASATVPDCTQLDRVTVQCNTSLYSIAVGGAMCVLRAACAVRS